MWVRNGRKKWSKLAAIELPPCRGGGEGVVRTRRVVNRRSEVPLAWLLSTPSILLPPLSSRGGRKTVKVKLISEICRNGAFLKDRAMFSYAGGGGGEGWRRYV